MVSPYSQVGHGAGDHPFTLSHCFLLGAEVELLQADQSPPSPIDQAANSTDQHANADQPPTPNPAQEMQEAKKQAYLAKIKKFQQLKGQKWDPVIEEELARQLLEVDSLMDPTPAEAHLEQQLRQPAGIPGFEVEMSLRKYEQSKGMRAMEAKGMRKAKSNESKQKRSKRRAMRKEKRAIRRQLRKYEKLSVPRSLKTKWIRAKIGYRRAVKKEKMAKKSKHFQEFSKEHRLDSPAENAPDYPGAKPQPSPLDQAGDPNPPPTKSLGEEDRVIVKHMEKLTGHLRQPEVGRCTSFMPAYIGFIHFLLLEGEQGRD